VVAEEEVPESMMMVTSQTHVEERVEEMTEEQEKVGNQEREEKVTDHQEAAVGPEEVQEETMVELTTMETDQEEVVHVSQEPTVKEVEEVEEAAEVVEEAEEVAVEEDMDLNGNLLPNLVDWLELVKLNLSKKFIDSPSQSKNIK